MTCLSPAQTHPPPHPHPQPPHIPGPCSPRTLPRASSPDLHLAPSFHSGLGSEVFSIRCKWMTTSPPLCSLHLRHCVCVCVCACVCVCVCVCVSPTVLLTLKLSGSLVYLVITCHPHQHVCSKSRVFVYHSQDPWKKLPTKYIL